MHDRYADPALPPPSIRLKVKTGRYRYLWLKYVVGFDPRYHCARCLVGEYSQLIPLSASTARTSKAWPMARQAEA